MNLIENSRGWELQREVAYMTEKERLEIARMMTMSHRVSALVEERLLEQIDEAQKRSEDQEADESLLDLQNERSRRESEHWILSGTITEIKYVDSGQNGATILRLKDRRELCLFKSKYREQNLREGIERGTFYKREWLVGQIDRVLRLNIVPPTVIRFDFDGIGSAQAWVIGSAGGMVDWKRTMDPDDAQTMAILDMVTKNTDRHSGNFLVTPDGRGVAIDNGLVFSETDEIVKTVVLDWLRGSKISERLRKRFTDFLSDRQVREELEKCFVLALGEQSAKRHFLTFIRSLSQIVVEQSIGREN